MPRWLCLFVGFGVCCVVSSTAVAQQPKLVAESEPLTPAQQLKTFHLPPGFEIQLIAAEPAIQKPININFDARGRLWVTTSVEYPFPADPTQRTPNDTLRVLDDSNADGVPDRVSVFADGLNIPIGVTPLQDEIACYSIPNIYRFRDTNGDGKADSKEVAYTEFGSRDTHGMASSFRWWVDGWVYACHGFSNTSTVRGSDNKPIEMQSGNTYRFRPDGSHIEYFTHGQVNPFGLTFDPLGNVYSSDCHTKPIYMLLRGAWYPSFGKPHDGLGYGPEMIGHLHGSTGIAGITYYAADHFPEAYRDTMFIGNPVTGRVNHDRLDRHGSTFTAIEQPDFLVCDDPWFRPVDVRMAADGSLYIADFYNRIIGHYEVSLDHPGRDRERGRIWRIVYKGTENSPVKVEPASDLTTQNTEQLLVSLDSPNLEVRTWATHELAERIGSHSLEPIRLLLTGDSTARQRAHALWVLHRLDGLADDLASQLAGDADPLVRVHMAKALAARSSWRTDGFEHNLVVPLVSDPDAFVRRAAVEALGQHPNKSAIKILMELWEKTPADDTHLIHATRIALRDTLASQIDWTTLVAEDAKHPEHSRRLAEISLGIPTSEAGKYLHFYLTNQEQPPGNLGELLHHAARYCDDNTQKGVFDYARTLKDRDLDLQQLALRHLYQALQERRQQLPADLREWSVSLASQRLGGDAASARNGLEFIRDLRLNEMSSQLSGLVQSTASHAENRPLAIEVLATVNPDVARNELLALVVEQTEAQPIRQKAAEIVGLIQNDKTREQLLQSLMIAPAGLDVSIARGLVRSDAGGDALLAVMEKGKASRILLQDGTVAHELRFRIFDRKQERMDVLLKDLPPADERIRVLIDERSRGFDSNVSDVAKGMEVFKKNCSACHQVAGQGGKVGPQLDGVGVRGLARILEDVLDPNRNVDETFRSSLLSLADGQVLSGLIVREEGAVVVLANAEGKEMRIEAEQIEAKQKTALSPMPSDVAQKVTPEDFNHLLAFLLSQKQTDASGK